ncbi:DUF2612 domain-containing protein [Campylobacter coli]|nr:DUF2612 domain-containing protein [Campylobacter coli]
MLDNELYSEIPNQIQAQYRDTNIKDLISGIIEIKKKYIFNALKSLYEDNFSLSTAKGIGLDLWGNLLHFNRYIPSESGQDYNYFNFNKKNFYKLFFYDYNKPNYAKLDDMYFKQILLLIYQGMYIFPSIPSLNVFTQETFSQYGKVVVKDTTDMSYQVFVFSSQIPLWLKFVFSNFDVFPRPAGVGFKVIERILRRFGFEPDKPYQKPTYTFFNFNKKNFNKVLFYDIKNDYYPNFSTNESLGKDITQEDYQKRLEWAKKNISAFYNSSFYDSQLENSVENTNENVFLYNKNKLKNKE